MSAFLWTEPYGIADRQHHCEWNGYELWASMFGEWRVLERRGPNNWHLIVDDTHQTKGKDLQDAQQRAQAAAMIQHSLREQHRQRHG